MPSIGSVHFRVTARLLLLAGGLAGLPGCPSPFSTRFPEVMPRPLDVERGEAQVQDPYPDTEFGPEVGFRPLQFDDQRPEPRRAKEHYESTILRQQYGRPVTPASQFPGPYPGAVRM